MARPKKKGLDYFPVDTDIFQDVKIRRLIRRHKQAGFLLYMQLLCDIYRHSFYIQLTDDYCFDLAEQWNLTERGVKTMIRSMIEFGLFYNNLHRKDILTSCSIQERYFMVKGKNINLEDSEKELLLTSICTEKPGVLDAKSTQRKEKERKENNNLSLLYRARARKRLIEKIGLNGAKSCFRTRFGRKRWCVSAEKARRCCNMRARRWRYSRTLLYCAAKSTHIARNGTTSAVF